MWVHKWKLHKAYLMFLMKENLMAPLMVPMMDFPVGSLVETLLCSFDGSN